MQPATRPVKLTEEEKIDYIFYHAKLRKGQRTQAYLMLDYSVETAFRYTKLCENKAVIKCPKCKSLDISALSMDIPVIAVGKSLEVEPKSVN